MDFRRRQIFLFVIILLLLLLYIYSETAVPHLLSVGLLLRNRYIYQAIYRTPPLSDDADNASLLLYWTPFFENIAVGGFGHKPFAGCPVNTCVATNDRRFLSQARVVLFHGGDMSMWDLPTKRAENQLYLYFVLEPPPQLTLPLGVLNTAFNITVTYRRDSYIHMPYARIERRNQSAAPDSLSPSSPPPPSPSDSEPTVAWVVSHCHTHGRREDYVVQLRRHVAVDEFGACVGRPCPVAGHLQCYQHLARTHTFYLAFENSLCRDYITEKFFWALRAGLIPVVRGATRLEYEAVAPADSFLHVDDFAGPHELADHLRWLARNATALARLTAWQRHYRIAASDVWCRVCALMTRHQQPGSARVADLRKWWYDEAQCHQ